jgi:hypothetical protein
MIFVENPRAPASRQLQAAKHLLFGPGARDARHCRRKERRVRFY